MSSLHIQGFVQAHQYKDSVALMRVAQQALALPEVVNASLQMGTPANQDILRESGLLLPELAAAGPGDIMVVVQARSAKAAQAALEVVREQLAGGGATAGTAAGATEEAAPSCLAQAHGRRPQANLVQISVPGPYAAAEALKAVNRGLNVFLFSDNVPLEQEVLLKRAARERGVLVMGPDCGTAILNGVPLGFANEVRRGPIGLVAASGTGLQEVCTQIHRMGGGISHAIGTGGRDVKAEVGGISMLQGIELLAADPGTRVIAVLCKPPAPEVSEQVAQALQRAGKPAVVLFIGEGAQPRSRAKGGVSSGKLVRTHTLVDCAAAAMRLAGLRRKAEAAYPLPKAPRFARSQTDLRALFSGGTYAAEALALWAAAGWQVRSNVALRDELQLADPKAASRGHTALDLGDDAFTVGRAHPMIDPTARHERLLQEAADPATRVILLDVVIGHGAHPDPAAELAPVLAKAKALAAKGGRKLALVGFVCGTEADPQVLSRQEAALRAAGMVLAGNSANAAWLAAQWLL